ncbi:MAG: polysaccharide biosynthesis tyrosine autokinase [Thermoguttaceae bacterium]|jgi:capsular exopolysaccharide synthesis family protein
MGQDPISTSDAFEFEVTQLVHTLLRLVFAVRYRKNLVIAVMAVSAFLGGLYYTTRPRLYSSKAVLLVSQNGRDQLDASFANEESLRQNTMPTFEKIIISAKVLEGALQRLGPTDLVDFDNTPRDSWVGNLQKNVASQVVRNTTIIEVNYRSKDPQVAANVVGAVVQSYLDFMDRIHKGTAGEISRILTKERNEVAGKLAQKQEELLVSRRSLADLGFRSEGKTLHPMVQRAVYFNDALIAVQKQRVEYEAALAALQAAVRNGEDLGQYMMMVSDVAGKELVLNSLGLGTQDVATQSNLAQSMLDARAKLETMQQNLGPKHPEVIALAEKIRLTEEFLQVYQQRASNQLADRCQSRLGPWLAQMLQQKLLEVRKKEEILQAKFEETRAEAVNLSGQLAQVELLERDIKRLGDMNDVLLNQIASLDLKQNGQDVRVAVIEEPKVSASPVSPNLAYVVLFTLLGGFIVSLGLVTVFDALDDRFRSMEELQNRLGVPVLTVIQRLKAPETAGLQALAMFAAPSTPECEGFRTLRTALSLTHQDVHQILITSLEAGDGKTTALANLAVCYAQADKCTLLIDADLRRSGLTNLLNVKGTNGLSEILRLEGNIEQLAAEHIRTTGVKGLDILPAGPRPGNPAELLAGPRFSQLLSWAGSVYDMILIDTTPALLTADPAIISRVVDGVVMVVKPAKNRRRQVMRMVERYTLLKLPVLGLIVNAAGSETDNAYYNYRDYYDKSYGYYTAENDDDGQDDAFATEDCPPISHKSFPNAGQEKEYRPLSIPRRVA